MIHDPTTPRRSLAECEEDSGNVDPWSMTRKSKSHKSCVITINKRVNYKFPKSCLKHRHQVGNVRSKEGTKFMQQLSQRVPNTYLLRGYETEACRLEQICVLSVTNVMEKKWSKISGASEKLKLDPGAGRERRATAARTETKNKVKEQQISH